MYDGNIVLLAFFLGMFFSLYAEQVIRSVVYAVVSFVMGLPTKRATDGLTPRQSEQVRQMIQNALDNVFWLTIRDFQYTNPNKAALDYAKANQPEVYKAYAESTITNPPAEVVANGHGIEDVGDATPLYDNIWVEVKGGQ